MFKKVQPIKQRAFVANPEKQGKADESRIFAQKRMVILRKLELIKIRMRCKGGGTA